MNAIASCCLRSSFDLLYPCFFSILSSWPPQFVSTTMEASAGEDPVRSAELAALAMKYARDSLRILPAEQAVVVLDAALGSAISAGRHDEAREAMSLIHECQGAVDITAQLKVFCDI